MSKERDSEWQRKRQKTFIAFAILDLALGMEYSMIFPTLWLYLTTLVHSNHPTVYYSLVAASFYGTCIFTAILLGRLADRTRKVWLINQCGNLLIVIGNLMYTIHFSSLFLLAGRSLAGMGSGLRAVVYGEIGRYSNEKELTRYFAIQSLAYSVGFSIGPAINVLFLNVDFAIGSWRITYVNIPGLYMAVVFVVNQLLMCFLVHDLSEEYDYSELKIEEQTGESDEILLSHAYIWKKLLTNIDWTLLVMATFIFAVTVLACDMWLPLIVLKEMDLGAKALNIVVVGSGIFTIVLLFLLAWKPFTLKSVYVSYLIAIIVMTVVLFILLVLKVYHSSTSLNILLLVLYSTMYPFVTYMHQLPAVTLTHMIPQSSKGYVQGIQHGVYKVGALCGLLLSPMVYNYLLETVTVTTVISLTIFVAIIVRRKSLINPEIIF